MTAGCPEYARRTRHRGQQAVGQGVRSGAVVRLMGRISRSAFCRSRAIAGALNGGRTRPASLPSRIEHGQAGGVLEGVILRDSRRSACPAPSGTRSPAQVAKRSSEGMSAVAARVSLWKPWAYSPRRAGGVALGVDRDEQHGAGAGHRAGLPTGSWAAGQLGQGGRADVGAEQEAQELPGQWPFSSPGISRRAVGLGQVVVRQERAAAGRG